MKTAFDLHRTNETVAESGKYICTEGDSIELKQGDNYPVCPVSGKETTWRHAEHQHKTGDKVTESGHYIDADGGHVALKAGDTFPNCPKTGKSTIWKHE